MNNTKLLSLTILVPLLWTGVSAQGKTRAEVRKELIDLESVGYDPGINDPGFPCKLLAAEKRLSLIKNGGDGRQTESTGAPSS